MRRLGLCQSHDEPVCVSSKRVNFFELVSVSVAKDLSDWVQTIPSCVELTEPCVVDGEVIFGDVDISVCVIDVKLSVFISSSPLAPGNRVFRGNPLTIHRPSLDLSISDDIGLCLAVIDFILKIGLEI